MYLVSLLPAALLAVAIFHTLLGSPPLGQLTFPLLASILVCATHLAVLILYPMRRTKPLALLLGLMACVSLLSLFLLTVSSQRNYQIQSVQPVLPPARR